MPYPNKPHVTSGSRLVLRIENQYYAVELGTCLAEKYALVPEKLPPALAQADPTPPPDPAPDGASQ